MAGVWGTTGGRDGEGNHSGGIQTNGKRTLV